MMPRNFAELLVGMGVLRNVKCLDCGSPKYGFVCGSLEAFLNYWEVFGICVRLCVVGFGMSAT